MNAALKLPAPVRFAAADGYVLTGTVWRHPQAATPPRPVVIINPATSVRAGYYARFAAWLNGHGFDVLSYDYRGIGASRPPSLKGFEAGWIDWGRLDFEAALQYVAAEFPGQPVQVVAHSVGGFLIGLAASSHRISRVFTMGAQYAYWKDYARDRRLGLLLKWHVAMPALTRLFGYFPGGRLGWLEDTPRGVVRDWIAPHPRFEDNWKRGPLRLSDAERTELVARFAALRGATLAVSLADDEFGTVPAIQRLLRYYRNSATTHLHIRPADVGQAAVGHFAFFHSRFEHSLWKIPLEWLRHGRLPPDAPGEVLPPGRSR
ncbi:alpha/beta hydrolase [Azoarcus sp. DD4]|uniref:alpha/beta hydrolase family protein n=1 Tax=Azoarcus sp. DD4 TaxID=2027405 RepID=UPI00112D971F|nr:alpha/beta fold hydrolase [Azoarcus sp. DD4]QDF98035.1 alpha/beta hydrolase [Azoarcus sp. DD4]